MAGLHWRLHSLPQAWSTVRLLREWQLSTARRKRGVTDSQISFDLPVFDRLHSEILEMMVTEEPFELSLGILKQYVALRTSSSS